MMNEELLQYIWKHRLYRPAVLRTTNGDEVEIIDPGQHNSDTGPDFFNAKVKINQTLWAGCVEVHLKSSQWKQHLHHQNEHYNNVILHVVLENDETAFTQKGREIPALVLSCHLPLLDDYKQLMAGTHSWLVCRQAVEQMKAIELTNWFERLVVMKFENKRSHAFQILNEFDGNWHQLFFIMFARAMGFGVNSDAFEAMARSIPVNILMKHADNQLQIEALFFGQAGLLDKQVNDDYYQQLTREYHFLKSKYNLVRIAGPACRFLRLRPDNFPTIRLSQLAHFIYQTKGDFEQFMECGHALKILKSLNIQASTYWNLRYVFEMKQSRSRVKMLGDNSLSLLIINALSLFVFVYGSHKDDEGMKSKAIDWLLQTPPEKNHIVTEWQNETGFQLKSAFESQGLIYLKNNFCILKKCLKCAIGHQYLKSSNS